MSTPSGVSIEAAEKRLVRRRQQAQQTSPIAPCEPRRSRAVVNLAKRYNPPVLTADHPLTRCGHPHRGQLNRHHPRTPFYPSVTSTATLLLLPDLLCTLPDATLLTPGGDPYERNKLFPTRVSCVQAFSRLDLLRPFYSPSGEFFISLSS